MCDFFPDWDDIALAGAMSEEMAEEEEEKFDEQSSTTKPDKSLVKEQSAPGFGKMSTQKRKKSPVAKGRAGKDYKSANEFKKNNPYQVPNKIFDAG